jgi:hypothetical protein
MFTRFLLETVWAGVNDPDRMFNFRRCYDHVISCKIACNNQQKEKKKKYTKEGKSFCAVGPQFLVNF